jgi:SAM-dependent methyltransferase
MAVRGDRLDRLALARRVARAPVAGALARAYLRRAAPRGEDRYLAMQRATYEGAALNDRVTVGALDRDLVVGSWREHDAWPDYEEYLMRYVPDEPIWIALDFGCGPGRNIRRWSSRFARIDGADIARANLENARAFVRDLPAAKQPQLFLTNGEDCGAAPDGAYDFVFSSITLQHICVHAIRARILAAMFRCLRPGGRVSIQMGYGVPSPATVAYEADFVDAVGTNRACDVAIAAPDQPRRSLEDVGFAGFEHWIRPSGPGDSHPNWIFFTAVKPPAGA